MRPQKKAEGKKHTLPIIIQRDSPGCSLTCYLFNIIFYLLSVKQIFGEILDRDIKIP